MVGEEVDEMAVLVLVKGFVGLKGMDLVKEVIVSEFYCWMQGIWDLEKGYVDVFEFLFFKVVVYDYGVKCNILCMLVDCGCDFMVVLA